MSVRESNDHEERLAQLLNELTEQYRAGQTPNLESIAQAHPEIVGELRELWAVAQFADLAKLTATTSQKTGKYFPSDKTTSHDSSPSNASLPRDFGDFWLTDELGRGGMGVVYKAWQKSLDRTVALKMVREAHLASEADCARFRIEAEAAARLKHPHIVTVFEVGTANNQAYFCMEYVEGCTLAQKLIQDGPLPPREAVALVSDIARAVQHAHEQGVIHRDLKPSNILLSTQSSSQLTNLNSPQPWKSSRKLFPKVSDFGLAKRMDAPHSLTSTGAIVGTPSYMAPEQATGRNDLTPASDVYSLGVILYETLTGRPPFQAAHPVDILLMVLEQDVIRPRDLNPTVDRDLELICLKCLQKPPELRYTTAGQLADDLDAYLSGETVSTRPSGLRYFLDRLLRETHHAVVLENWGVLWMWHSLMIFLLCLATQILAWREVTSHAAYLILWGGGLLAWGSILWRLRRRAGPVLFVERQIAHAWAAGVMASISMFVIEVIADRPVLELSPAIAVAAGMVMLFKAGILSGRFYIYALANFVVACLMAAIPDFAHLMFGTVSAVSFFEPGLKYYRQRKRARTVTI